MKRKYQKPTLVMRVFVIFVVIIGIGSNPALAAMENPYSAKYQQISLPGWIAFIRSDDGSAWLVHPDGSELHQLNTDGGRALELKWSPDGMRLGIMVIPQCESCFGMIASLVVIEIETNEANYFAEGMVGSFDWSPDGNSIYFTLDWKTGEENESRFKLLNVENGEITSLPTPLDSIPIFEAPKVSKDGTSIALTCWDPSECQNPILYDLPDQSYKFSEQEDLQGCNWEPSGEKLACVQIKQLDNKYSLFLLDRNLQVIGQGGEQSGLYPDTDPLWSPFGERIAVGVRNINPPIDQEVYLYIAENGDLESEPEEFSSGIPLDWSPDGRSLLVAENNNIYIVDIQSGERTFLAQGQSAVWQPSTAVPPITDLRIGPDKSLDIYIHIAFTIPHTISQTAQISEYDIRYSRDYITEENWPDATELIGLPEPEYATPKQEFSIAWDGELSTPYYFAMKSRTPDQGWSRKSNVALYIDSGFRVAADAYQFRNGPHNDPDDTGWKRYPIPPAIQDFTMEDMRHMFGDRVVCQAIDPTGSICIYYPIVGLYNLFMNLMSIEGHCTGMAFTSYQLYMKPEMVREFVKQNNGSHSVFEDLNLVNMELRKYITFYQLAQLADPMLTFAQVKKISDKPEDIYQEVSQRIINKQPAILEIKIDEGYHALLPYALVEFKQGVGRVYVYDSNVPGELQILEFDKSQSNWKYTSTAGGESKGKDIYLIPFDLFEGPFYMPGDFIGYLSGAGANLSYINDIGQMIGYRDGVLINGIPDADILDIGDNIENSVPSIYVLPPDGTYSAKIDGANLTIDESMEYFQFGPGYGLNISDLVIHPDDVEVVQVHPGGNAWSYKTSGTKEINARFAFSTDQSSVLVELEGAHVRDGDTISLQIDPDLEKIRYTVGGPDRSAYGIKISLVDSKGEAVFQNSSIETTSGQSQIFNIGEWDGKGPMNVQIDKNRDAVGDGELTLKNELDASQLESSPAEARDTFPVDIVVLIFLAVIITIMFVVSRSRRRGESS
jgi:dipeptidyl aminopeptidase/acylaminoacyl peptidase